MASVSHCENMNKPQMSRSRSRSYSRQKSPQPPSPPRELHLSRSRSASPDDSKQLDYKGGSSRTRERSRQRSRSRSSRRYKSRDSRSRSRSNSPYKQRSRRRRSQSRSPYNDRRRHENPQKSRCLGVFGLNVFTTRDQILKIFQKFGPIERVQVVVDAKTGRSRGYCFVYFETTEDAKRAKEQCSRMEIDSRKIRVDYSITQRAHAPTPGVYMGRPTRYYRDRENERSSYRGGERDRDDDLYYSSSYRRRSRDRRSPSPYHSRERKRRYDRSRSRSYSPRDRRYR